MISIVVIGVHLHRRILADLLVPAAISYFVDAERPADAALATES